MEFALSATLMLDPGFWTGGFQPRHLHRASDREPDRRGIEPWPLAEPLSRIRLPPWLRRRPLSNLSVNGQVIVSSVFNNNNRIQLTGQVSQGGIGATSLIGSVIGGTAILPATVVPQLNQTVLCDRGFL